MRDVKRKLVELLRKHSLKVFLGIIAIIFLFMWLERVSDWFFVAGPTWIQGVFASFGLLSPVVFVILYIVGNMLLIPSIPFTFTSGVVFGLFWGIILSLIGEVGSASVNYYLGSKVHDHFVHRFHGPRVRMIQEYLPRKSFLIVFIFRYFGFYFDVVSCAAGAARMRFKPYLAATFLGFMPYIFLYVYSGYRLVDLQSSQFMYYVLGLKVIMFAAFGLAYLVYRLWKKR